LRNVYVVQETSVNILSASKFLEGGGEFKFLLPPTNQIMFSPGPSIKKIKRGLEKFNSNDFLLLIGDPSAMAITAACASEKNNGKFTLLKWDRREATYYPIKVDLNQKGESYE
jgi:hypothetical protein|tara:strand:+ start:270 stop:608 length:339 start_codon:yes stop_codon:yes gene_type:complete